MFKLVELPMEVTDQFRTKSPTSSHLPSREVYISMHILLSHNITLHMVCGTLNKGCGTLNMGCGTLKMGCGTLTMG